MKKYTDHDIKEAVFYSQAKPELLIGILSDILNSASTGGDSASQLESKVSALEGKVNPMVTKVSTLEGKVTPMESKLSTLEGKVTPMVAKVTTLEGKVTPMEGKLNTLNDTTVPNLSQKVETLEQKVEGYHPA